MNSEEATITAFIGKDKRDRYLSFLAPKNRAKLHELLSHSTESHLNRAYIKNIAPNQQHPANILALLAQKGAPSHCRVISEYKELDGKDVPLKEAVETTVGGGMGTIICCIPGRLAYFEGEGKNVRFFLEK